MTRTIRKPLYLPADKSLRKETGVESRFIKRTFGRRGDKIYQLKRNHGVFSQKHERFQTTNMIAHVEVYSGEILVMSAELDDSVSSSEIGRSVRYPAFSEI